MKKKKLYSGSFSPKRVLIGTALGIVACVLLVAGIIAFEIVTDEPPQFFPLDNPAGEYTITKMCPGAQGWQENNGSSVAATLGYCVEYKGRDIFMNKENGSSNFFRITVGKSAIPIESLVGKRVKNIHGHFVSSSKQCISGKCIDIGGPVVVLNIDNLQLDR